MQAMGSAGIKSCAAGDWLEGRVVGSSHSALGAWNCLMRQTFYRIKQKDDLFHGRSKQDQMKEGRIQQATWHHVLGAEICNHKH